MLLKPTIGPLPQFAIFGSTWRMGQREEYMSNQIFERREKRRYALHLPIHYRVAERGGMPFSGTGTTCELSSSGLSFRCRRTLPVGANVELMVDWPSRYGDQYPVELQITGFIMRTERGKVGVRVNSHKFRVDQAAPVEMRAIA